jgi:hypothetical protein
MPIDNSTSLPFSLVMANLNSIIPIISVIFSFILGYFTNEHFQKSSNMREKVMNIDKNVFAELRGLVDINLRCLKNHDFFDYDLSSIRMKNAIRSDNIERILLKSDIYERENESLVLSYKKDKILKKYSPRIIEYSKVYSDNIEELEKIVERINYEKYYDSLERGIEPLLIKINRNIADIKNNNPQLKMDLQRIILSILFDSPKSFPNGNRVRLDLLEKQFKETQKIVFNNPDLDVIGEKITRIRNSLIFNLEGMQKELKKIHNEWRDHYHISYSQ